MMRKLYLILMLFLFSINMNSRNRALIVGVGDYPEESGWRHISSLNDVSLLCSSLPSGYEIQTLTDASATHEGIINLFDTLVCLSMPGDTLFVHFSCHGQQMLTDGKEEPDYLDESLVPYDASSKRSESYWGQNHLIDNEIGVYIDKFRRNIVPDGLVVVTVDACFSDSMNKGGKDQRIIRGGLPAFGTNYISEDSLRFVEANSARQDSSALETSDELSDIIILSACKTYERNMEIVSDGTGYGSLSYAISQSFLKYGFGDLSLWLKEILTCMDKIAYLQEPQVRTTIEGLYESDGICVQTPMTEKRGGISVPVIVGIILLFGTAGIIVLWKRRKK